MDMSDDTTDDAGPPVSRPGNEPLDLSPRDTPSAPPARTRRKWGAILALVAIVAVGGVVVTKFLTDAIDYYCDVEDVGLKPGCDADRPIRIQGIVKEGTRSIAGGVTTFTIVGATDHAKEFPVHYSGVPSSEIFQDCVRVVVHGQLRNGVFEGDNVDVKHDNNYAAADEAGHESERSAACLQLRPQSP